MRYQICSIQVALIFLQAILSIFLQVKLSRSSTCCYQFRSSEVYLAKSHYQASIFDSFANRLFNQETFYNNCLISRALIASFLSSIRVQTDKILIYANFQQFNFQLSNCQLFSQWDFDFLKKPIKQRENLLTMFASF